ncbi:MAG: 3-phosphoserine/phosphohydroxythreonine transaminase [Zoogloeaceae bacterium]|jgi:phosphoserine aminotransferase|nr:3-phosphoserine/phosphohydroxythreonine transaminase [Zoogloeaceae bacterium]
MRRVWNMSAGPAALPTEVVLEIQREFPDWRGIGAGIMEVSHRGKAFSGVIEAARADLRELLDIPESYAVLFLQGGASLQFAQVPMNLAEGKSADYLITGAWSQKAYGEAARLGKARVARADEPTPFSGTGKSGLARVARADEPFTRLPGIDALQLDPEAAYLHLCGNETIHGVEIDETYIARLADRAASVPLVSDMSSHILSRPMDVRRYGLLYAGAQKNIGIAGLTIVIVRADLLERAAPGIPAILDYRAQAANDSMLNTPPTFAIYVAGLVFKWLKRQGGLDGVEKTNRAKADRLYAAIDESDGFYTNHVDPACRSRMNVPFNLPTPELEGEFVRASEAAGFMGLKGHKSVGGIRASLYNAVPEEGVEALIAFMTDFRQEHAN